MGRGLLVGLEVGSQWLVGWEALVFEGLTMESGSHVHSPKPDWQQPTEAGPGHGHQRPFFFQTEQSHHTRDLQDGGAVQGTIC